ncbi:hypothetical protein X975_11716, partial [Stegodyphus mimosarum]
MIAATIRVISCSFFIVNKWHFLSNFINYAVTILKQSYAHESYKTPQYTLSWQSTIVCSVLKYACVRCTLTPIFP